MAGWSVGARVILFLSVLLGLTVLASAIRQRTMPPAPPTTDRSYDAFGICRQFVTDRLRATTSAKFADLDESSLGQTDGEYRVVSFVDSQNPMGVMLRTKFDCRVVPTSGRDWQLISLTTTP